MRRLSQAGAAKLDCRSCGICCVSLTWADTYANIEPVDEKRLGRRFVRLHVLDGAIKTRPTLNRAGPLKGAEDCRCVALRGSVGERVSCMVYEKRPDVCRKAVRPGDRACRDVRRMFAEMCEREGIEWNVKQ